MKSDYVFFWGGTFSQWCPSNFEIDGVKYNCGEQYMMAKKAMLFNDNETLGKIMKATDPRIQKALGRTVKNFEKSKWDNVCRDYVYEGNYAKFTQNGQMKKELLNTGTKEIVEASPEDTIWGIGLRESDPRAWDKTHWLGTNWLGEAIMRVRKELTK